MKGLSPKQRQVLGILEVAVRQGEHLTVREIGDRIEVSSTCTVHQHLKALERKGYLKPTNHKHRSLELTQPPRQFTEVPFRGQAASGAPGSSQPPDIEAMLLPSDLIGQEESLMFQVLGDGIADGAVRDGDLVIAFPSEIAEVGDVVVSAAQGGAILKRLTDDNRHVGLNPGQPEAAFAEDIPTIVGRVSLVIRRL